MFVSTRVIVDKVQGVETDWVKRSCIQIKEKKGSGDSITPGPTYLVSDDDEGEVIRVMWLGLVDEVSLPVVEVLEGLLVGDVIHKDACISSSVEWHSQRLESPVR